MGVIKTLLILVAFHFSTSVSAFSGTPYLTANLAECVGRLSAELEHAWLMNAEESIMLAKQREQLVDILDAMMAHDQGAKMLSYRIDAKMAQARLLTLATFGSDPTRAAWAKQKSTFYVRRCTGILLDS